MRTIALIFLLILIPISSAIQLDINHKEVYCFNCHGGSQGYSVGQDEYCGDCHSLYSGNQNFKEQHEAISCKGCHKTYSLETFHPVHKNISCNTCHIDNTLPDNKYYDCLSCHISGLHSTHLEKSCETCHQNTISPKPTLEVIQKTTQNCDEDGCWEEIVYENNINETKSINTSKPITNYKRFTILQILVNIYEKIIGDIYG